MRWRTGPKRGSGSANARRPPGSMSQQKSLIQTLQDLSAAGDPLSERYARLLSELEKPELLYFALLFHDVGKGMPKGAHSEHSVELATKAMDRIQLEAGDRETVLFLIRHHLEMSATMTGRDISESETIQQFSNVVGAVERLKALTLMTFADIGAVNPKAMTDWRKDLLWQLYISSYRYLSRDFEERRIHAGRPSHRSSRCYPGTHRDP